MVQQGTAVIIAVILALLLLYAFQRRVLEAASAASQWLYNLVGAVMDSYFNSGNSSPPAKTVPAANETQEKETLAVNYPSSSYLSLSSSSSLSS